MFENEELQEKKRELHPFLDELCQKLDSMDDQTEKIFNVSLCAIPILVYIALTMLGFGIIIKFMIVALVVSLEALLYSFKVLAWILNLDDGTPEMKEIANTIVEGSEGFFKE